MTTPELRASNLTEVDIKKISYAVFMYRTKDGQHRRKKKPEVATVHGREITCDDVALYHTDYPKETMLERARRLDVLDKWEPLFIVMMSNGHRLEFTGERACKLRDAWRAYIYQRKKKK